MANSGFNTQVNTPPNLRETPDTTISTTHTKSIPQLLNRNSNSTSPSPISFSSTTSTSSTTPPISPLPATLPEMSSPTIEATAPTTKILIAVAVVIILLTIIALVIEWKMRKKRREKKNKVGRDGKGNNVVELDGNERFEVETRETVLEIDGEALVELEGDVSVGVGVAL